MIIDIAALDRWIARHPTRCRRCGTRVARRTDSTAKHYEPAYYCAAVHCAEADRSAVQVLDLIEVELRGGVWQGQDGDTHPETLRTTLRGILGVGTGRRARLVPDLAAILGGWQPTPWWPRGVSAADAERIDSEERRIFAREVVP